MKKTLFALALALVCGILPAKELSSGDFRTPAGFKWEGNSLNCIADMPETENGPYVLKSVNGKQLFQKGVRVDLPGKEYAGKLLRFTAEVCWKKNAGDSGPKAASSSAQSDRTRKTMFTADSM